LQLERLSWNLPFSSQDQFRLQLVQTQLESRWITAGLSARLVPECNLKVLLCGIDNLAQFAYEHSMRLLSMTFVAVSFVLLGLNAIVQAADPNSTARPGDYRFDGTNTVSAKPLTMAEVLTKSKPSDWRQLDPENTLYLELAAGRVIIELAPDFAPQHVANVKALAREHYFDGLAILRVQDNYVVQWGDPDAEKPELARKIKQAKRNLPPEFESPLDRKLPFTPLSDRDVYAQEVGFSQGFPVAREPKTGRMWLVHCYGMVGAGRDVAPDSGGGTELYAIIGHAPRHLDRNVTLLGRVVQGIELLSALPRGTGQLGFYENAQLRIPIKSVRVAADIPASERTSLELFRTDTPAFQQLIESRRNRREEWYQKPAGRIEICNVPLPVRAGPTGK
jgi:peptidylprolyl isomerase